MAMMLREVAVALCLLMSVALSRSADGYTREEALAQAAGAAAADGGDGDDGGLEGMGVVEESGGVLPLEVVPDPFLASLEARLPFYAPQFLPQDMDDSADTPFVPVPLKRGRYNRLDILKRSRLNQLIHRLLAMRGDRYSYHRASPVRFAAGRR